MNPRIASILFSCLIAWLFYLNRDRDAKTSPFLWLAVTWIFIGASRMASQWLSGKVGGPLVNAADQYLEGSPLDRAFLATLQIAGMAVLCTRGRQVATFLRANKWLIIFFLYCAISCVWSDFPDVAFKRWVKFTGNVTMVLVILTDQNPAAAFKRVLTRAGFFLIALSVLFVKYYPELSRGYIAYTWQPFETGVSTDKNGLGAICLVFGLASVWRLVEAWHDKETPGRKRVLIAHMIVLVMTVYLLHMARSSTSLSCFFLGSIILVMTNRGKRLRARTAYTVVGCVAAFGLLAYIFNDAYTFMVESLGRNPDLTGRTDIWHDVLEIHFNPWLGTGYESFWLGSRLDYFWHKYPFHPNQAHNGYIETYLNLGLIGLALTVMLMASGVRTIGDACRRNLPWVSLKLCFLIIAAIYNITEAAFKVMQPVYIAFLFAVMAVPIVRPAQESGRDEASVKDDVSVPSEPWVWAPRKSAAGAAGMLVPAGGSPEL